MVPQLCQFYTCRDIAEILWCPDYVNLQRFHGAPSSQFTEILQRFYGATTMSIYRDFAEISWCPDYANLQRFYGARLCQFTESFQRFYGALTMSIYRDFIVPPQCQFT